MSSSPTGTKARALLVDDNALERFVACEALEQAGLEVEEAVDGAAALESFERRVPDVVLLDVKMPRMDGFACCRAIRAREDGANVPVLMLTGLDDLESINQAYEVGATDFYSKPMNAATLVHRVRYLLRSSRIAEELRLSQSHLARAQRMAGSGPTASVCRNQAPARRILGTQRSTGWPALRLAQQPRRPRPKHLQRHRRNAAWEIRADQHLPAG